MDSGRSAVTRPDEERFLELAVRIADGIPVDWAGVGGSDPSSPVDTRNLVEALQRLEGIARGHEVVRTAASASVVPARDTLLTAARRYAPDTQLAQVEWGPLLVREKIGRGAFADVYRAWDPKLARDVALKVLRNDLSARSDSPVVEEGRLLARVRHPNVITVYGAERVDDRVGVWMEYLRGQTLADEVRQRGPMRDVETARIAIDVLHALDAVHRAGLVHRDVKAQNVMRDRGGRIVLTDFGASVDLVEEVSATARLFAGTPLYAAPERFLGRPASIASDLYSVGVLMFHLASGDYPVRGRSLDELRDAHARRERTPLQSLRRDVSPRFAAAIERALEIEPERRFDTAAAMANSLQACLIAADRNRAFLSRRAIWAVVTGVALLTAIPWLRPASRTASVPFAARDWVLITAFENRTDNPVLDGTIEHAIEREIASSRFVNVVPRERVDDALLLMRRSTDTRVDRRLGAEIALRDGRIRVLLAGKVESASGLYLVTAQIVNPADGSIVATVSEEASDEARLGPAIRLLSLQLRDVLGEELSSVEPGGQGLERATTPSLRALQLYSEGLKALYGDDGPRNFAAGEQLLRQALAEDPEFAMAHLALADAVARQNDPGGRPVGSQAESVLPYVARAEAAAARASDIERLYILAKAHEYRGDTLKFDLERQQHLVRSAAALEALLRLQPDDYRASTSLAGVYRRLERFEQARDLEKRMAQLRPNDSGGLIRAAQAHVSEGRIDEARVLIDRARALDLPIDRLEASVAPWFLLFDAHAAWLDNDLVEAAAVTDRVAALLDRVPRGMRPQFELHVVSMYLTLGRLDQAERTLLSSRAPADLEFRRVLVLSQRDDATTLRAYLRQHFSDAATAWRVGPYLIDAGMLDMARAVVSRVPAPSYIGQLALAERRFHDAIEALTQAVRNTQIGNPGPLLNTRKLADALRHVGRIEEAITVLEEAVRAHCAAGSSTGYQWILVRERLAALYREVERDDEAEVVESELLTLLSLADEQHPLKRRLIQRAQAASSRR